MSEYGYIGSTPTQGASNSGLFNLSEHQELYTTGKLASVNFTLEYLIIGGGGPGALFGTRGSGGGGAGGYRSSHTNDANTGGNFPLESVLTCTTGITYGVAVGAGGAWSSSNSVQRVTPPASIFYTIAATGGGFGDQTNGSNGGTGGSGGGQSHATSAGRGVSGQGQSGGTSSFSNSNNWMGTGGGGADGVGSSANSGTPGPGGAGESSTITGTSVQRAGGGGGAGYTSNTVAAGGAGGGGSGNGNVANSGSANTGGGGGAGNTNNAFAGNGGSGVVILLYPDTRSIIFGTGLTGTETDRGDGFKYAEITAGEGVVSFI